MSNKTDKSIGPNRPFDPTKETREEYELNAVFPIGIFSEKNGLVLLEEFLEEKPSGPYPGDRGDEAVSGSLYSEDEKKEKPTSKIKNISVDKNHITIG